MSRFADETLIVNTRAGFPMRVITNDLIGRHLYFTGQFDQAIPSVLSAFAGDQDVVLDVGANVGFVSCALLHRFSGMRVVCVEPQSAVFDVLRENVLRVGGQRATPINAALSDHAGNAHMTTRPDNSGAAKLTTNASDDAAAIAVRTITGADLLEQWKFDRLDMVKIDVEGHERTVLQTLRPMLQAFRPKVILFEHDGPLEQADDPILHLFSELEYDLYGLRKSLTRWRLESLDELRAQRRSAHDYVAARPGVVN